MSKRESGIPRSHFLVLLALADVARHGLGIAEEIDRRTNGAVQLGPGTLYGTLKRLAKDQWVEEAASVPDPTDHDPRRRYWQLTSEGRAALSDEVALIQDLMAAASDKALLPAKADGIG